MKVNKADFKSLEGYNLFEAISKQKGDVVSLKFHFADFRRRKRRSNKMRILVGSFERSVVVGFLVTSVRMLVVLANAVLKRNTFI